MGYYDDYFDQQLGGGGGGAKTGYGGISRVYVGSPNQRGHGIGSFLGGLFRRIIPLLKQGARAVGKEALRSGISMASDIMDSGIRPKEAFKTRVRESGENLKRKAEEKLDMLMKGSGYKETKIKNLLHSLGGGASRRIGARRKRKKRTATSKKRASTPKRKKTTAHKKTKKKTTVVRGRKKNKKPRSVYDIFA